MPIPKEAGTLGMPWEQSYGYAQAVRVGDTIWVSGQLSHDNEGNIVGPAPVDAQGRILDHGNMRIQMAQCYANARKVLAQYGATLDNVVEEVLYVTDMDTAFAVAGAVRAEAYGGRPVVASTILVTPRLAFPSCGIGSSGVLGGAVSENGRIGNIRATAPLRRPAGGPRNPSVPLAERRTPRDFDRTPR